MSICICNAEIASQQQQESRLAQLSNTRKGTHRKWWVSFVVIISGSLVIFSKICIFVAQKLDETIEMKYTDFENIISPERMRKYVEACSHDTRRARSLYRINLRLSQEMFALVSMFEVSLRNRIDKEMKNVHGDNWLRDFIFQGGVFDTDRRVEGTKKIIKKAYDGLANNGRYTHSKLLAEMEFGVWKYMFNNVQYRLTGRCLLNIFTNKPTSTKSNHYDNTYIYNELDKINAIRNRIAHHEPICFGKSYPVVTDTQSVIECYNAIMRLFEWMAIDTKGLLYGIDHINTVCSKIMFV